MCIPCYLDSTPHKERVTHNRETNGGQSRSQARGTRAGLVLSHRQRQTSWLMSAASKLGHAGWGCEEDLIFSAILLLLQTAVIAQFSLFEFRSPQTTAWSPQYKPLASIKGRAPPSSTGALIPHHFNTCENNWVRFESQVFWFQLLDFELSSVTSLSWELLSSAGNTSHSFSPLISFVNLLCLISLDNKLFSILIIVCRYSAKHDMAPDPCLECPYFTKIQTEPQEGQSEEKKLQEVIGSIKRIKFTSVPLASSMRKGATASAAAATRNVLGEGGETVIVAVGKLQGQVYLTAFSVHFSFSFDSF